MLNGGEVVHQKYGLAGRKQSIPSVQPQVTCTRLKATEDLGLGLLLALALATSSCGMSNILALHFTSPSPVIHTGEIP